MLSMNGYHAALKRTAIVLVAVNVLTCLTLDLREWLVYFDPWLIGAVVLPAFLVGLPLLPFLVQLDRTSPDSATNRLWLAIVTVAWAGFESLWFLQIVIATCFRGPLWNFYWPWEEQVPKVQPLNSVDLSEYFWISLLRGARPAEPLFREMPGIVLMVAHLVFVPCLACLAARRFASRLPWWRIFLFALILQLLLGIAGKIVLRHLMDWKYLVSFPEQMLNV